MMLKRLSVMLAALCFGVMMSGQVPQFSPTNFTDWVYSNPAIELNQSNIMDNRVVLYTNSEGRHLTLTSPMFDCHVGQTIDMTITWVTRFWQSEDFVVSKAGVTAAIIDRQGVALDSVTFTPTSLGRQNEVKLSLTARHGLSNARLRFASWKADIVSSGAIRMIVTSSYFKADVNHDGEVTVADVNAIIDVILGETLDMDLRSSADVNGDGEVSMADINGVIDVILG